MKKNFMAIASLLIAAMLLVVSCAPEAKVEGKVEDGLVEAKLNVAFGKAVNITPASGARILYKYSLTPQWDTLSNGNAPYGQKSDIVLTETNGKNKYCTISESPSIASLGKVTPGLWKVDVNGYLCEKDENDLYTPTANVVLTGSATVYFGNTKDTVTVFVAPVTSDAAKGKISINLQMQDLENGARIMYKLDGAAEYTPINRSAEAVVEGKAAHSYEVELTDIPSGYHTISFKIENQEGGITRSFYLLKGNDVSIVGSVTPSKFAEESAKISVLQLAGGEIELSSTTPGTTPSTVETSYGLGTTATATATFNPPSIGNGITSVVMSYAWYWGTVGAETVKQEGTEITDSSNSINITLPSDPGRYTLSCLATCTVKYLNSDNTEVTYTLQADAALQEFLVD